MNVIKYQNEEEIPKYNGFALVTKAFKQEDQNYINYINLYFSQSERSNYLTKQAHFKGISCMANLPNKKEIITGGKDCKISIIELKFLSVLITYCEHPAELTSISIFQSCLGKNGLITGDKNGNLIFWKNGGDTLETEYLKKFENKMKLPS